ncbi:MAG: DUF3089 domain-containing protein [Kordiimonadaceae bacterium]|nr:DUF3089 domain-containing protein [Kordiimonadaceae bacterium]
MAKSKVKPAAVFLLVIIAGIVIMVTGGILISANMDSVLKVAFIPSQSFEEDTRGVRLDYTTSSAWAVLPGDASHAMDTPVGLPSPQAVPAIDIFYVHPTTYLNRAHWNAPHGDKAADEIVDLQAVKLQASAFNTAGKIYAPRYRQATFGVFYDKTSNGVKALDLALGDVLSAFDTFIADHNNERPFILVGHSQGAAHLLALLHQRITGTALQKKMVAAYLFGWPVSLEEDLGAFPDIGACASPSDIHCVISYQTYGQGGDPARLLDYMDTTIGLTGKPRKGSQMLCTNPFDWRIGTSVGSHMHLGGVLRHQKADMPIGPIFPALTGTACSKDGILYVSAKLRSAWQQFKLAGENYHIYDVPMFYMNIRENAALRASSFLAQQQQNASNQQSMSK